MPTFQAYVFEDGGTGVAILHEDLRNENVFIFDESNAHCVTPKRQPHEESLRRKTGIFDGLDDFSEPTETQAFELFSSLALVIAIGSSFRVGGKSIGISSPQ